MTDAEELTVACLQTEPVFGDPAHNRTYTAALVAQVTAAGARVVVAPELCIPGYAFQSREEAFDLAEPADGPTAAAWANAAAAEGACVIGGICERVGDTLFNSAIVVDGNGLAGIYRKVHLWNDEKTIFSPGDLGFPVFDTPFGRIGMLICYDLWFPEAFRSSVLNGADIVCVPTAWIPIPAQNNSRDTMHNLIVMTSAHTNSVPVICADRIGREKGLSFIGRSLITAHTGWPVAGPASSDTEEILFARIAPAAARQARSWTRVNDLLRDRRPDQYQS